jgi:hypothetical protein
MSKNDDIQSKLSEENIFSMLYDDEEDEEEQKRQEQQRQEQQRQEQQRRVQELRKRKAYDLLRQKMRDRSYQNIRKQKDKEWNEAEKRKYDISKLGLDFSNLEDFAEEDGKRRRKSRSKRKHSDGKRRRKSMKKSKKW